MFFIVAVIISSARGSAPGLCATALASCAVFFLFKEVMSIPFATQSMMVLFVLLLLVVNFAFHKVHLKNAELILKNAALANPIGN